jgi:hypothetical protein
LQATNVIVSNKLPTGAVFVSASAGCTAASGVVTCSAANLASGSQITFTITVSWQVTGAVYDVASLSADQNNLAPANQQQVQFGLPADAVADVPLPAWAYVLLALGLLTIILQRTRAVPLAR